MRAGSARGEVCLCPADPAVAWSIIKRLKISVFSTNGAGTVGWVCVHSVAQSCPTLCDPVDCSRQAPLSMGFSRQEHWSGLLVPPTGDLPDPGIEPESLMPPASAGGFFTTGATWEALEQLGIYIQEEEVGPLAHTVYKSQLKDLNGKAATIKLLEENTGVNLHDLGFDHGFLDMTPKGQATKEKK